MTNEIDYPISTVGLIEFLLRFEVFSKRCNYKYQRTLNVICIYLDISIQASNCIGFNSTFLTRVTQLNLRQITLVAKEISKKVFFALTLGTIVRQKKA